MYFSGIYQAESGFFRGYASFDEFREAFSQGKFEAVIVDPGKPGSGGMEMIHQIRLADPHVPIIIYTDQQEYLLEGYTVSAFRYILKSREKAEQQLTDAVDILLEAESDQILDVNEGGKRQPVFYRDIVFVECIRRNAYLHLVSGKTMQIKNSIREIAEKLCSDQRFAECYRDIVVNVTKVAVVKNQELILSDGGKIPLSRRRKTQFRQKWSKYSAVRKN